MKIIGKIHPQKRFQKWCLFFLSLGSCTKSLKNTLSYMYDVIIKQKRKGWSGNWALGKKLLFSVKVICGKKLRQHMSAYRSKFCSGLCKFYAIGNVWKGAMVVKIQFHYIHVYCMYINSSAARGSGNVLSIPCRQQTHPLCKCVFLRTSSNLSWETE